LPKQRPDCAESAGRDERKGKPIPTPTRASTVLAPLTVADKARLIAGLDALASTHPGSLEVAHGLFGLMSVADRQRWAYKHTDHHLRQFGL
jgi:hypothetical protein